MWDGFPWSSNTSNLPLAQRIIPVFPKLFSFIVWTLLIATLMPSFTFLILVMTHSVLWQTITLLSSTNNPQSTSWSLVTIPEKICKKILERCLVFKFFLPIWVGWPCPARSGLKRPFLNHIFFNRVVFYYHVGTCLFGHKEKWRRILPYMVL